MYDDLLLATGNPGKVRELREILAERGLAQLRLHTLAEFPNYQPPEEDGDSFAANAAIKAQAAAAYSGLLSLADDSGLCVEALQGAPGVYSARYAGPEQDDAANRRKLLAALASVPWAERQAAFVCCAALAMPQPDGTLCLWSAQGRCEGLIALAEQGEHGFGYDSLFFLPEQEQTMAQLDDAAKNAISHRGRAMAQVAEMLQGLCVGKDENRSSLGREEPREL